ncbi:RING-H2 finger protein ATL70-like [Amaranthus tricolor]|uniref:RING-H2 finger protein ATL70-like n=1 Tax=Amaranthus tricolor TaxID=29722 RepID=UPI002589FE2E|nr:RING-H2 finger protein ATL70-like [Amaranthus tricolor]
MNSTNTNFPEEESSTIGGFTYGVGVSLGILILITTITLASYFCTRDDGSEGHQQRQTQDQDQDRDRDHIIITIEGIDEDTLKTYPKCLYSQLENNNKINNKKETSTINCCSICLADYKGKDVVRQLGECGHVFHQKCVDPWLRLHPTCPVCRTSPLPTPQSTPLAEVAPLASSRIVG